MSLSSGTEEAPLLVIIAALIVAYAISSATVKIVNAILYPDQFRAKEKAEGVWPYRED